MKTPADSPWQHPNEVLARRPRETFDDRHNRGAGSLAHAEAFCCVEYKNDIRRQISFLCESEFPAGTGLLRNLGYVRRARIKQTLMRFVGMLDLCAKQSGDYSLRLRNTTEFGTPHLVAILRAFADKKTAHSTIHTDLSALRKFMTLLGRRDLVPGTHSLALLAVQHDIPLDLGSRRDTAFVALNWSAIVNIELLMQDIQKKDKHVHLLCELCLLFGLRESELVCLHPVESDEGDRLWVWRGAKGGRHREIPLSTNPERRAQQRSAIDRAKAMCRGDPSRHLGFDKTLVQARRHFERIMDACGVTQRQLGIKRHGARYEYAVQRFRELTGLPAPVLRQAPLAAYVSRMAVVQEAIAQLSLELGHERAAVVAVYIGSLSTLREEEKEAELAVQVLAEHRAELAKIGVAAITVTVVETDERQYTCTLYIQPAGHAAGHDSSLVARVRGFARACRVQKVDALLAPAPANANAVTVSMNQ